MWLGTNMMGFPHAHAFLKVPSLNPNKAHWIFFDHLNHNREAQYSLLSLQSFLFLRYALIHRVSIVRSNYARLCITKLLKVCINFFILAFHTVHDSINTRSNQVGLPANKSSSLLLHNIVSRIFTI